MNPSHRYFIGLDLGQSHDPTALSILEEQDPNVKSYHIRHLHRYPLGTSYPDIVEDVCKMLKNPIFSNNTWLAVDQTGVGAPVVDLFRKKKLHCTLRPIQITGGSTVNGDTDKTNVPKRDLISVVQLLLQTERLKVAEELPDAKVLMQELRNFQMKITINANEQYGAWREGTHDDLVLSVAMASWVAVKSAGIGVYI